MTKQELEVENNRLKETIEKLKIHNKKLESLCETSVIMKQEFQRKLRQYE